MSLSNDLISQFVKITRDQTVEKKESIVYGTTVEYESKMYVKIDGSDLLTPITTTADLQAGERVTVMIKDHTATVTGNITSPSASSIKVNKLEEDMLQVDKLIADKANIKDLDVINADIKSLKADKARIDVLETKYADINTLVNGHLTSENIQSLHLTAANTTIENALIKDAMIDTVSASKINTGIINTNNVSIQSDDGSMLLQGNLQQFKDKDGKVRIQIGKDATGNFTFALYDATGKGQLINQNGIQSSDAIKDGLIVDSKVADNANINGSKLDISSVISNINNNTSTIKASHIKFDDTEQTLDVSFNQLKKTVDTIKDITIDGDLSGVIEQVTTNTTNIGIAQGQISTLIDNTTITKQDGTVTQLKDEYNKTKDTVNEHSVTIGKLETNYKGTLTKTATQYYVSTSNTTQTGGNWIEDTTPKWENGKYIWQRIKYTYGDGSITYSTPVCIQGAKGEPGVNGEKGDQGLQGDKGQSLVNSVPQWYLSTSNATQTGGSWVESMPSVVQDKYLWLRYKLVWQNPTQTTYTTPTLEQVAEQIKDVTSKQSKLEQSLDGFKMTVSSTYATKEGLNEVKESIQNQDGYTIILSKECIVTTCN